MARGPRGAKLRKRQFEMELKFKLEKQIKLNLKHGDTGAITQEERRRLVQIELRRRKNKGLCPVCFEDHVENPPDDCWNGAVKAHPEIFEAFNKYVGRNGWGGFSDAPIKKR